MSLLSVAEALQPLERDGLVESRPLSVLESVSQPQRRFSNVVRFVKCWNRRRHVSTPLVSVGPREKRIIEKMADHMDAIFNRSAAGTDSDRDFLYAFDSYHLEFHLPITEFTRNRVQRATIEKNHVLIFNWLFDIASSSPPLRLAFIGSWL